MPDSATATAAMMMAVRLAGLIPLGLLSSGVASSMVSTPSDGFVITLPYVLMRRHVDSPIDMDITARRPSGRSSLSRGDVRDNRASISCEFNTTFDQEIQPKKAPSLKS